MTGCRISYLQIHRLSIELALIVIETPPSTIEMLFALSSNLSNLFSGLHKHPLPKTLVDNIYIICYVFNLLKLFINLGLKGSQ